MTRCEAQAAWSEGGKGGRTVEEWDELGRAFEHRVVDGSGGGDARVAALVRVRARVRVRGLGVG